MSGNTKTNGWNAVTDQDGTTTYKHYNSDGALDLTMEIDSEKLNADASANNVIAFTLK